MDFQYIENYFEYDAEITIDKRKYLVVIIYDIMDNKRRAKVSKFLQSFGFRVQKSAFECIIDGHTYDKLIEEIRLYIAPEDLIRIYKLHGYADVRLWGSVGETEIEEVIIV